MNEGLTPHSFHDDSEFDRVEERVAPTNRVPLYHNGIEFVLTPANATVRMFFGTELKDYSRVLIYPGDGTISSLKLEDELLQAMVRGGFPVELPDGPDETDKEFMDGYMHIWTEDINAELGLAGHD